MRFIDQCRIKVMAGDGGNGVVAFRREKFIPFGGPSGGDGGKGGDVKFVGAEGMSTLQDITHQRTITADRGGHGEGSDCYGRGGDDRIEKVPLGTQIFDDETGELLRDITTDGEVFVAARGGKGGRGNIHFATSFDRAPRRAEKGERGEARTLRLELKVMADVGLLGFPNVGKSTFVASVSAARPKVADYAFTTLIPTLGMVDMFGGQRMGGSSFVIADIPGLIPGASDGIGLGVQFLKHVERTRVLLHLVTLDAGMAIPESDDSPGQPREPLDDYLALREELEKFSPELATRPEIVALSKLDIPEVREAYPALAERFAQRGVKLFALSAATREGMPEMLELLYGVVKGTKSVPEVPRPAAAVKPTKATLTAKAKAQTKKSAGKTSSKKTAAATAAKKTATKTSGAKKASPKKAAPKKAAPKKATKAKAVAKKTVTKKSGAKKPSGSPSKKVSTRPATKKSVTKKPASRKKPAGKRK